MNYQSEVGPSGAGGSAAAPLPGLSRHRLRLVGLLVGWRAAMVGFGPNLSVGWAIFSFLGIRSALRFVRRRISTIIPLYPSISAAK